jgi:hypothetical protein
VEIAVGEERFSEPVELAVYLIVLEVLRSDYGGNEVTVEVAAAGGELVLDVHGASAAVDPLRDRIEALGGHVEASANSLRTTFPID